MVYQKLFRYVPREKYIGIVAIIFSVVSAFLTVMGYYFIYKILKILIVENNVNGIKEIAIKAMVFLILGSFLYLMSGLFSHFLGFRLETNLRKKGIDGLTNSSFKFFDLNSSGMIRKIIDDNASQTHTIIAHLIPDNSQAFLIPIFAVILGFITSLRVGISLLMLSITVIFIVFTMMKNEEFINQYQKALNILSAEITEYVRGIQIIKIFNGDVLSIKALYRAITNYSKYAYNYSLSCRIPYSLCQLLFFGVVLIIIPPSLFFIDYFKNPDTLVVEIIMIIFLSGILFVSFIRIMWLNMFAFKGNYAVETLEKLFDNMQKDKLSFGKETKFSNYNIEFDNVSFGYNDTPVLENLSFKLTEKKVYALVGTSGSGKSTIAKLISGFYKIDKGEIKIGDKKIESYTQKALTDNISFVFQDAKLFKSTIYENVKVADETASEKDILKALELAECNSILDKFPNRENTLIGSEGVYLSGGEKQRIAIARAILKNSKIIIMDEASASIDTDSEYQLQKAFKNLIKNKTVIIIAHRLSSIKSVDEIIVLEKGKIIERGTYNQLMNYDSEYRKFENLYKTANKWRVGYEENL